MKRPTIPLMLLIAASIFVFFLLNLLLGSVSIPIGSVWNILWGGTDESVIWQNIIWKSRVPQALTALVAGAGLSISGLQMQTVFRNPLAGPSVLGISSGASLGVAFCCARKAGAVNKRQKNRRRQSFLFISLRIKDAGSGCCAIV